MRVLDVYNYINSVAPFSSQEPWDNSGHLIGSLYKDVTKAVVCLDVTDKIIDFACEIGANLIISHHPVIFSPVKSVTDESLIFKAVMSGLAIICAHTNLDKAPDGVNDALCESLGLDFCKIYCDGNPTFLNVCKLSEAMTSSELAAYIKEKLGCAVSYCDAGADICNIGLCTGAGADFIDESIKQGCNAFITGEAKYHQFLEAEEKGISLFTVGHFESEVPVVKKLTDKLNKEFNGTVFVQAPFANTVIMEK